jgi:RNHCP domain
MEPVAVTIRGQRRWMLIHRFTRCMRLRMNRTAANDNVLLLMRAFAHMRWAPRTDGGWTYLPRRCRRRDRPRPRQIRGWGSGAGPVSLWWPGGQGHVVVAEAVRRPDRARSRSTAAVAPSSAAPSAIRVICQPARPEEVMTVAGGGGATVPPGHGTTLAKAAGTMAADASRPLAIVAVTVKSRQMRVPVLRGGVRD